MKAFAAFFSTAALWALLFQQGLAVALEARQDTITLCEPISLELLVQS